MYGVFREIIVRLDNGQSAIEDIERLHSVGNVDHPGFGMNAANNPFHYTDIMFGDAEIGCESDKPLRWQSDLLPRLVQWGEGIAVTPDKSSYLGRKDMTFWPNGRLTRLGPVCSKSGNFCFVPVKILCNSLLYSAVF